MPLRLNLATLLFSMSSLLFTLPVHAASFFAQVASTPPPGVLPLHHQLQQLAPQATPAALRLAAQALNCADPDAERLAVIDYSLPSTEPRLWEFDLHQHKALFHYHPNLFDRICRIEWHNLFQN